MTSLTVSIGLVRSVFIEMGTAQNEDNGWSVDFIRTGGGIGLGVEGGLKIVRQRGSLDSFARRLSAEGNRTSVELEIGAGYAAAAFTFQVSGPFYDEHWRLTGGGLIGGYGVYLGLSEVASVWVSKPYPKGNQCANVAGALGPTCYIRR